MSDEAFPAQTAWTVVLDARDPASPTRRARLERLAGAYWRPVCAHLRGSWGLSAEDAAPERGRFRTFLKIKLRDLVIGDFRRRGAQKRGGRETR